MIYLSKLILRSRSKQARCEVENPHELHYRIAQALGKEDTTLEESSVLYRIDTDPVHHVLVQTKTEPDWSELNNMPDYLEEPVTFKSIKPTFRVGDRFLFRLKANPTLRVDGKRYGLYETHEQTQWLVRKGEDSGFAVKKVRVRQDDCVQLRGNRGRVTKFATVQYDGELAVVNPLMFIDAVENGVGSAKAMGYGLLSLARQ
jgi:CRISPR system Cascade subunit CasE